MIKTQLLEEIMPDTSTEDFVIIMTEDGPRMILKSNLPSESMMMDTTTSVFGDAGRGREIPQELRANGGRIGFKKGSPEETSEIGIMAIDVEAGDDDDIEDMDMAAGINFSRQEKSYLFRRLGGSGGSDRSYTMPNLYRILSNPGRYPEDAAILKEIAIMGLGGGRKDGGRIGFNDGSSTGNFGADRYASELVEAYGSILNKGDMFLTDVEKELIERGEYPSPDKMKDFQTRYENLEKEYEKEEDKFGNIDLQDSLLDEDAIKYYNKKVKDLEDKEDRLMNKEEKLNEVMYTDLDVSGILKTPEFQEWYRLWKAKDPKADDLPNAEYFENMMFDVKRLIPDVMKTKYDVEMKDGGLMDLGGKEMDLRKGGFVPIGKKERADDVPARLSKNEFVMTADAVRAAGGGSVNKGAKRMYDLMNNLEARV